MMEAATALAPAPHAVPAGCPLTVGQFECVAALAQGHAMKQIALRRGVTHTTVRTLLHQAYRRLNVSNATQCVAVVLGAGWLDPVPALSQAAEAEDRRVTPAQRLYLDAFDRFLASGGDEDRAEMRHMLEAMCYERRIDPACLRRPRRSPRSLPFERLAA